MRKFLTILCLFFAAPFALAQGVNAGPYTALKTVNGLTTPIADATITVCAANTGGIPCSPALVNAVFQNTALTVPLSNPFTADANGNYSFAIAPGNYTVTVTAFGFFGYSAQVTVGQGTAGGVTGGGTINLLPIWTSPTALGNSTITFASGTPNTYSTPDFMQIGFGLVTTGSSLPGPALLAEAVPSFTGTGGGSIIGATIQAQDSSVGNPTATVSSIIGAQITAAASTSGTGQTATVGTIYGVLGTAKAPARANVTTLRSGYFSAQTGSGSATVTNFRALEAFNNYIGAGTVTNGEGLFVGSPSVSGTITHQYGIYVDDQTVPGTGTNSEPHGIYVVAGGIQHKATAFNALPACASAYEGTIWAVNNSTTATWGATITGGGTNHVLAYCDGTNWTVAAD